MTVEELQKKMSSVEFAEWMAFERIEPGEPIRGDYRAASIRETIANSVRTKGKPFEVEDFLLRFVDGQRTKGWKEIKNVLVQWKDTLNKRATGLTAGKRSDKLKKR